MKNILLILSSFLIVKAYSQSTYYYNDTTLEYTKWRHNSENHQPKTEDSINFKAGLTYYLMGAYTEAKLVLDKIQENDSMVISLKRNIAVANQDFTLANYHHRKLSKGFRKNNKLRRYFISQLYFQPIITTSNFFDIARPYFNLKTGISTDPISRWNITHNFALLNQTLSNYNYSQSNYSLNSIFQINKKVSFVFNYTGDILEGNRNSSVFSVLEDTVSNIQPIIDSTFRNSVQTGSMRRGINRIITGFNWDYNRFNLGFRLGVNNQNFKDSLIITNIDTIVRKTLSDPNNPITNSVTINEKTGQTSINSLQSNHQFSLMANYTPKLFNNGIKLKSWIDVPFNSSEIGISPYLKVQFRLTPNTWLGGWIRHYSNLSPIEMDGNIFNPGLDQTKLKYGGEINYHKSKRWWVIFNLELQKRKEYYTNESYSILSLDFKFQYRIYK
tara:strand:+ start:809 stop:2137 length:1329 start_codon:yes stop_codon:yes gene_type:complete